MNRKTIKKIMLFLLAFMLVFPVYSFGKAEAVQAAALKAPKLSKVVRVNKVLKLPGKRVKALPATMLCVRQKTVPGKKSKL